MKTSKGLLLLLAVLTASLFVGCTQEGLDGSGTINGIAAHHSAPIAGTTVYIKFGAKELPGTNPSDFDASVTANGFGEFQFDDVQKGNYYIYGIGYDSTISQVVSGGRSVKLAKGGTVTVELAVTEQ